MATGFEATDRALLKLIGADAKSFLQDLVTNDVDQSGLVYAALLSPQGKYLFDFFVLHEGDAWVLECAKAQQEGLLQRLSMYRLRADVAIERDDRKVFQLWDTDLGLPDPRDTALGNRLYASVAPDFELSDQWDALRVSHLIPEAGRELVSDESFILECGFERLNGVDFKKGCYVGQEVTARMKHKTELRKGLARVQVAGPVEEGAELVSDGKTAGRVHTVAGDQAIAYVRFDRAKGELTAGDTKVTLV